MKMSKYIILILSFLMILTITSCKKEQDRIEDNYNFILNVEKQNAKIAELGKTITNQQLIYLQEDSSTLIYVKYNFTENMSTQKIIYRFFIYYFLCKYLIYLMSRFKQDFFLGNFFNRFISKKQMRISHLFLIFLYYSIIIYYYFIFFILKTYIEFYNILL